MSCATEPGYNKDVSDYRDSWSFRGLYHIQKVVRLYGVLQMKYPDINPRTPRQAQEALSLQPHMHRLAPHRSERPRTRLIRRQC